MYGYTQQQASYGNYGTYSSNPVSYTQQQQQQQQQQNAASQLQSLGTATTAYAYVFLLTFARIKLKWIDSSRTKADI